jgi:hypothetical protein
LHIRRFLLELFPGQPAARLYNRALEEVVASIVVAALACHERFRVGLPRAGFIQVSL